MPRALFQGQITFLLGSEELNKPGQRPGCLKWIPNQLAHGSDDLYNCVPPSSQKGCLRRLAA